MLETAMDLVATKAVLIDFDHLAQQSFSDEALERDLLDLFAQQCGALLPVIAGAASRDERFTAVHTLNGSARAVGAWGLATLAERAEALLRNDDTDAFRALADELAEAARATQAAAVCGRPSG